jgi:carotenoid cleavage dioxygenase
MSDAVASLDRYDVPVPAETSAVDLPVRGTIPPALAGTFVRNGPNAREGSGHRFFGEGMLHGVRLAEGRAAWYRSRFIRPNTSVLRHAGQLYALMETTPPQRFDADLTAGADEHFGGALAAGMTAHPKLDPHTGELFFYDMRWQPQPQLFVYRADASGTIVDHRNVEVGATTMMHDCALTSRFMLLLDLPLVFDLERAKRGTAPFSWQPSYGARIGLLDRSDVHAPVRWFEIAPCYVFHVLGAYDEGDEVVLVGARYPKLWDDAQGTDTFPQAYLHRWRIDVRSGAVREDQLDEQTIEFPRADPRRSAQAYAHGYALLGHHGLIAYDLARGTSATHDFGPQRHPGEPVFIPAHREAAENDGWLMTYVYDAARDASDLVILDARDVGSEPVATIALPVRVPLGFHGDWFADAG